MQVVGRECVVCRARIVAARDARPCASCAAPLHGDCGAGHTCAGTNEAAPAAGPAPARPDIARSRWVRIGVPALAALVASAIVPRFRSWQSERRIAERAAVRLGCTASEVAIEFENSGVTARGCGTRVHYLRVCGQIDRAECLEEIEAVPGAR